MKQHCICGRFIGTFGLRPLHTVCGLLVITLFCFYIIFAERVTENIIIVQNDCFIADYVPVMRAKKLTSVFYTIFTYNSITKGAKIMWTFWQAEVR